MNQEVSNHCGVKNMEGPFKFAVHFISSGDLAQKICIFPPFPQAQAHNPPVIHMRLSTSSTSPSFNFHALLDDALAKYTKRTGKCLADHPLTASLDRCRSPDDVLAIFQKQAEAFDEFRNGDPKLMKWLRPIVGVLHQLCTNEVVTSSACAVSSVQTLYHRGRRFRSFFS
jgi:hypothetical protein